MSFMELSPYITEEKIQSKVKEMGAVLTQKLQGKSVVAVCVLKGSFMFYSDLIRNIDADVTCDFFGVSSYHGGTTSSGEVRTTLDLSTRLEGRHVLLVEDIVDTGLSMNYLINAIKSRKPASLTTVSLLEKPDAIKVPCELDVVGFKIPNDFVVGYGLDYQGMYRNLPYIAQVQNFQ
jgi:hypoxanthine phosphoribosyltransferase